MADQCFDLEFLKDSDGTNATLREERGDYLVRTGSVSQAFEYYK